jgi:hypothetical protein
MALHAQLQHTIRQLQRKCDQLAFYTGNKEELQQTLALIEQLTGQAKAAEEAAKHPRPKAAPKSRSKSGPTPQPDLPHVPLTCALDDADRQCPSCGGALKPMGDQAETSEMIDVVEVSYRIVDVRQPKYVCACGGCVETAPEKSGTGLVSEGRPAVAAGHSPSQRRSAAASGWAQRPRPTRGGARRSGRALGVRAGGRGDDGARQPMGMGAGPLTQKTGMGSAVATVTRAFRRSQ